MSTENTLKAITLVTSLLREAMAIQSLIQQAQAEGRDLTREEMEAAVSRDDAARQGLVEALTR
jgi:hypothetical protein